MPAAALLDDFLAFTLAGDAPAVKDGACADGVVRIEHAGRWADLGAAALAVRVCVPCAHAQGGESLMLVPAYITATPLSATAMQYLTSACPCGGAWAVGTPRNLTNCGAHDVARR